MPHTVAILLFEDVELLDFAGPHEVFSVAGRDGTFEVYTVAEQTEPLRTRGGLTVVPDRSLEALGTPDVFVIPGGQGARTAMRSTPVLDAVREASATADVVLSVCTGAFILAAADLLDECRATTHHSVLDDLADLAPNTEVVTNQRFVDNGPIVTAAGISAGIDAALHVVERLEGRSLAETTARHMEYTRTDW